MTLNMKNYKGYNKEPYCNAHYPTTKFTAVADTPEARRLQENTKIQSQVQYHAEFEKQKGRKIEVTDDPELLRHQKNTAIMSNVAYHGVLEQKEGQEKRRATLGDLEEAGMAAPAAAQPVPQAVSQPVVQQDPRSGNAGGAQMNGGALPQASLPVHHLRYQDQKGACTRQYTIIRLKTMTKLDFSKATSSSTASQLTRDGCRECIRRAVRLECCQQTTSNLSSDTCNPNFPTTTTTTTNLHGTTSTETTDENNNNNNN